MLSIFSLLCKNCRFNATLLSGLEYLINGAFYINDFTNAVYSEYLQDG